MFLGSLLKLTPLTCTNAAAQNERGYDKCNVPRQAHAFQLVRVHPRLSDLVVKFSQGILPASNMLPCNVVVASLRRSSRKQEDMQQQKTQVSNMMEKRTLHRSRRYTSVGSDPQSVLVSGCASNLGPVHTDYCNIHLWNLSPGTLLLIQGPNGICFFACLAWDAHELTADKCGWLQYKHMWGTPVNIQAWLLTIPRTAPPTCQNSRSCPQSQPHHISLICHAKGAFREANSWFNCATSGREWLHVAVVCPPASMLRWSLWVFRNFTTSEQVSRRCLFLTAIRMQVRGTYHPPRHYSP